MNKNPQTDRPAPRPLFVEELGTVQGGRDRNPTGRDRSPTTRSNLERGGISE